MLAAKPGATGLEPDVGPSAPSSPTTLLRGVGVPVVVVVMWVVAMRQVELSRMTDLGLVSVIPPLGWVALVVLSLNFVALLRRPGPTWALALHVVVFILIIHATPALLYGSLRYAYSWKHVGIVDYFLRHGAVDRNADTLSAYHNWPGFFALVASVLRAAGLRSALGLAVWAPPVFNLLLLGPLLMIFRSRTVDRRLVWLAVWIFYVSSWVGQDYFSPQAFAYFLYLVVLAIVLKWFKGPGSRPAPWLTRVCRWAGPVVGQADDEIARGTTVRSRAGLAALTVVLMAVVASSHQLTPFMLIAALVALVLVGGCRLRVLPLFMIVTSAAWVIVVARPFVQANLYWMIVSIGHPGGNADSNLVSFAKASRGQVFIALVDRGLSAAVLGLAVLGFVRRRWHGGRDASLAVLALSPVLLLGGNSYGGEMLFRVYLFALPFAAFFAAAAFVPSLTVGRRGWTAMTASVTVIMLLAGFLVAYYGKERVNYFTDGEVAASRFVSDNAPVGSLVVAGTSNYPWGWDRYERMQYVFIGENEPSGSRDPILHDPVAALADLMADPRHPRSFLVVTRSQKAQVEMTGLLPAGFLDRLVSAASESGRFVTTYANRDAQVLELAGRPS